MTAIFVESEPLDVSVRPIFQVFFLKNDREQSVRVVEVEEVDFEEVKAHIEHGESVFISQVRKNRNYAQQYRRRKVAT